MRTKSWMTAVLAAGVVAWAAACGGGPGDLEDEPPAMVYAAASLRDVAAELGAAFAAAAAPATGRVRFNFAGSNVLAQQVVATTGADLFVSADREWIEHVERAGRAAGVARPVLENRLVLAARRDSAVVLDDPWDLAGPGYRHLAIADPAAVPAGRYARAYLERFERVGTSLWQRVAPRVVPTLDVRAALALVESDPEIIGIVYRTDVLTSPTVDSRYELAPLADLPIAYWAVPVAEGESPPVGRRFLDFLGTEEAHAIARRHGFLAPTAASPASPASASSP